MRTKHVGRDMGASLTSIVGGELRNDTERMTEARQEALGWFQAEAPATGAAVTLRFATADVVGAGAEILAYGTAVVITST